MELVLKATSFLTTLDVPFLMMSLGSFLIHVGMYCGTAVFSLVYETCGLIDGFFLTTFKDVMDSKVPQPQQKEFYNHELSKLQEKKKKLVSQVRHELGQFCGVHFSDSFDFSYNIKKDAFYVSLLTPKSRKLYYQVLSMEKYQKELEVKARHQLRESLGLGPLQLDTHDKFAVYVDDMISRILHSDLWHSFAKIVEKELKILSILAGFITAPALSFSQLYEKNVALYQEATPVACAALFITTYFGYLFTRFTVYTISDIISFFILAPFHIYATLMDPAPSQKAVPNLFKKDDAAIDLAAPKINPEERLPVFTVL